MAGRGWLEIDWAAAACRDADPEQFFPVAQGAAGWHQAAPAKAVCARCTLRTACLDWALSTGVADGVWGGYTADERRAQRRTGGRTGQPAPS